jgi:hypothetical protein
MVDFPQPVIPIKIILNGGLTLAGFFTLSASTSVMVTNHFFSHVFFQGGAYWPKLTVNSRRSTIYDNILPDLREKTIRIPAIAILDSQRFPLRQPSERIFCPQANLHQQLFDSWTSDLTNSFSFSGLYLASYGSVHFLYWVVFCQVK